MIFCYFAVIKEYKMRFAYSFRRNPNPVSYRKSAFLVMLLVLLPCLIVAQSASDGKLDGKPPRTTASIHVPFDSTAAKFITLTALPLTYHAGDILGADWTKAEYNDNGWGKLLVSPEVPLADSVWQGIGCFRLRVSVDSAYRNTTLILRVRHVSSAAEIYWDGRLCHRFGRVHAIADSEEVYSILGDAVPLYCDTAGEHILAVRYSAHVRHEDLAMGFRLRLQSGTWAEYIIAYNRISMLQDGSVLVTCAVAGVLCLLHILMFFAYRKNYVHWWIAALWGILFLSQLVDVIYRFNSAYYLPAVYFESAGLIALVISYEFSLFVLYRICYGKVPKWSLAIAGLFLVHLFHRLLPVSMRIVSWEWSLMPIVLVITFEVLRLVWETGKRIPYIRILAFGFVGSFIGYIISGFFYDYLFVFFGSYTPGRLFVQLSIVAYPMSFTVYAAQEFTRRERLLARQNEELEMEIKSRTNDLSKANAKIQLVNTELQEVNEELSEMNHALDEANHFKTQMLSIVAHDLKNPLNVILNCADMLSESMPEGTVEQTMIAGVHASADRMVRLIHDLLDNAAIELGKMEILPEPLDWGMQIVAVGESYQEAAAHKRQTLDMSDVKPSVVVGDEERLWQVVDNLISNAVKYSPLGSTIIVRCHRDTSVVRLSVQDFGPGLTDEDKTKLFGHFQRLSAQPTAGENSSGVGLSIVKKIVELHKGRIWVESEYGKGAKFIVELPVA
ncbi:MAG: HAMP domain-containing histidine kinase [Ignavibacteria bacterium]|nr:HAMP domain-containing histidine kinase [Ignavibacteria bacterium]